MTSHRNSLTLNWLRKLTRVSPTSNHRCCHAVFTVTIYDSIVLPNRDCTGTQPPAKGPDHCILHAVTTEHRLTGKATAG